MTWTGKQIIKMNTEVAGIIAFVENFKNEILMPLATAGILNAEIIQEAKQIFAQELEVKTRPVTLIRIEKDGKWGFFHPQNPCELTIDELVYGSVEHYRVASSYFGSDQEFVDYIRESKTPAVAHRRGEAADNAGKARRIDYEATRDDELKKAYAAFLIKNPNHLKMLKESGDTTIHYAHSSDQYLGTTIDGKGYNAIGKVLMALRKEFA